MKRVYPLTKKTKDCGETLYDQHKKEQASPKRKNLNKKLKSSIMETTVNSQIGYGTDEANASGEEIIALGDKTISDAQNQSVFKKGGGAETSYLLNSSIQGRLNTS